MYSVEEFDIAKTKVVKYIMYKKRTENEVREKFKHEIAQDLLEDIIEYCKEAKYIDDIEYIKKAINNFLILKKLSIVELNYKLLVKGLNRNLIEDYIYENKEELNQCEINSAKNIINKKRKDLEPIEIKKYLMKKGYKQENIEIAFEGDEEI